MIFWMDDDEGGMVHWMWGSSGRSRLQVCMRETGSPQMRLANWNNEMHIGQSMMLMMVLIIPLRVNGIKGRMEGKLGLFY